MNNLHIKKRSKKKIKCIFLYNQNKNKTINVIDHKVLFCFELFQVLTHFSAGEHVI